MSANYENTPGGWQPPWSHTPGQPPKQPPKPPWYLVGGIASIVGAVLALGTTIALFTHIIYSKYVYDYSALQVRKEYHLNWAILVLTVWCFSGTVILASLGAWLLRKASGKGDWR